MKKFISIALLSFFLISGLGAMIPQLFSKPEIKPISFQAEDFTTAFWSGQFARSAAMIEMNATKQEYLASEELSYMAIETFLALNEPLKASEILESALAKYPNSSALAELSSKTGPNL